MNRILQQAVNKVMGAFVGSGVSIDEHGQLCLPDGLCPNRDAFDDLARGWREGVAAA